MGAADHGVGDWAGRAAEAAGIAAYAIDVASRQLTFSSAAPQGQGLSLDDWLATVHPADRAGVAAAIGSALAGTAPLDHRFRLLLPDGTVRWILDRGRAETDDAGRVLRVLGAHIDVTAQGEADGALRESEELFRRTFELANVGVAHVSAEGRFLRVNRRLCQLLGRDEATVLSMTFQDLTHPEDLDADLDQVARLLAGEIDSYTMEKRYVRPDGSVVWADLAVALVRQEDGAPRHFVSVMNDIHARKQAQEQVVLVLGEANHRIKNLITVISAIVRTSARGATSVGELQQVISSRIMGIAASHDLLMGKYASGAAMDQLVQRQLDIFTDCSSDRIALQGPPVVLTARAVHAFGMVLHELATNACKYGALSDSAGRVRIAWQVDEASGRFAFRWEEADGPPVVPSGHMGFGTRTLERMLAGALGGTSRHTLAAEGAIFEASVPLAGVVAE